MFPNLNLVWTFMLYTMVCRVPHWSYWRYNWWTTNYDLHCSTNFSSDSFSCWVDNCDSDCGGCYCSLLPPQKEEEGIQSVSFVLYIIMMTVMIVLLIFHPSHPRHPNRQHEMELQMANPSAHEYVIIDHIKYTMSCSLQLYRTSM